MSPVPTSPPLVRRPLVVRLCNMVGDVVLSLPALQLLQSQGYELHLYGKGWAQSLLAGHGWRCTTRASKLGERIAQLKALRAQCLKADPTFDQRANTLVMPNSFSSAFEARWAGLKPMGYARDGRSLLLNQAWQPGPPAHALEGFWGLACRTIGQQSPPPQRIHLIVPPAEQLRADELLAKHDVSAGFVCIVPYAAGDVDGKDKRWPDFPELTKILASVGMDIVTCPGPGEEGVARLEHPDALCLPGLSLGVYLGVLKRASLVISNDTGPAHMAAAVGAQVLSVLGPTKPEQWRPWGPQNTVVQGKHALWPEVADVMQHIEQVAA